MSSHIISCHSIVQYNTFYDKPLAERLRAHPPTMHAFSCGWPFAGGAPVPGGGRAGEGGAAGRARRPR
eukprot:11218498-Lingulodinium_polyedra.AAC.1